MRLLSYLSPCWLMLLLWGLSACESAGPIPLPPEPSVFQPQLFAHRTENQILLNWGWFTWDNDPEIEGVSPTEFTVLLSENRPDNLTEVALLDGNTTSFVLDGLIANQVYYVALRANADSAKSSQSRPIMVMPGEEPLMRAVLEEDGRIRTHASWGPQDLWITYERLMPEGKRQLYRFDFRTNKESFVRNGYAPSSARNQDRLAFLLDPNDLTTEPSPNNSLLIFSENGTEVLFESESRQASPTWSPEGEQLAFLSNVGGEEWALWRMKAEAGAEPDRVIGSFPLPEKSLEPQERAAQNPVWTPEGEAIFYDRYVDKGGWLSRDIMAVSIESGNEKSLIASEWNDMAPACHPDGQQIAFLSDRSGKLAIWLWNQETLALTQLTGSSDLPLDPASQLSWDAHGRRLLFTSLRDDGSSRLMYLER